MTQAHADEQMDAVLEQYGAAGYGAYWLIVEHVAAAMDVEKTTPEATHSERKWCEITHLERRVFRKLLAKFGEHLMEVSVIDDGRTKIYIPNILKFKDEYSRKSGHSPDKLPARTDQSKSEQSGAHAPSSRFSTSKEQPADYLRRKLQGSVQ